MDSTQQTAIDIAISGHNLIISGLAGTGKSFVIRKIVKELEKLGKRVAITSSTGISATHLHGITLHKWSGISDGRFSDEEIFKLVSDDERFISNKNNILETDVLLIDEISMISKKTLCQVEQLCRRVRPTSHLYFGGIQVVLSGDFFQLPPVKDIIYSDYGHYAFETYWFK